MRFRFGKSGRVKGRFTHVNVQKLIVIGLFGGKSTTLRKILSIKSFPPRKLISSYFLPTFQSQQQKKHLRICFHFFHCLFYLSFCIPLLIYSLLYFDILELEVSNNSFSLHAMLRTKSKSIFMKTKSVSNFQIISTN